MIVAILLLMSLEISVYPVILMLSFASSDCENPKGRKCARQCYRAIFLNHPRDGLNKMVTLI